jgi:hypothetical protein
MPFVVAYNLPVVALSSVLKAVLLGAAQGGIDIAGSTAFDGAWPILSKALEPVLDQLKSKLGADPAEHAAEALAILDSDKDLQATLELSLQRIVTPLRDSVIQLNEGQERLLALADGNEAALSKLAGDLKLEISQLRTQGVAIVTASQDAIADKVAKRVLDAMAARQDAEDEQRRATSHVSRACLPYAGSIRGADSGGKVRPSRRRAEGRS